MKRIYSTPQDELPLKNDKCAASCTDLHLANRGTQLSPLPSFRSPLCLTPPICFVCCCTTGITHLRGFEKFTSLKTLWLNGNKLQSIIGLDENVQLNSLHLHCNRIKRLEKNGLAQLKLLSRLTLNDNLLDDFDGTLQELKCMRNLSSLDLHNNPIAEEDNYRLRVLAVIPSLKIFDLHRFLTISLIADSLNQN
jgi:Leucine-rich repeat (LRR) protein